MSDQCSTHTVLGFKLQAMIPPSLNACLKTCFASQPSPQKGPCYIAPVTSRLCLGWSPPDAETNTPPVHAPLATPLAHAVVASDCPALPCPARSTHPCPLLERLNALLPMPPCYTPQRMQHAADAHAEGCVRREGGGGGGLKGGGGGDFGWDPPPPGVPLWSPSKAGQKS